MKKRIISIILATVMIFCLLPMTALADSTKCGANLTWSLSNGTLTIGGTGDMYNSSSTPWRSNISAIKSVVIGDNVTSIGDYAFQNCTGITSVKIGRSVSRIGKAAFNGCIGLRSITIPDNVTSIGEDAFNKCSALSSVNIGRGVKSIYSGAFYSCKSLKEITIPNNVTSIGSNAFKSCTSLKSATIGKGITTIGTSVFYSCTALTNVAIPTTVTKIGSRAFYGCSALKKVSIPDSVTTIDVSAFSSCNSLTRIMIPDSVTSIDTGAFYDCGSLSVVYYLGSREDWQYLNISSDNRSSNNNDLLNASIKYNSAPIIILSQPKNVTTATNKTIKYSIDTMGCGLTYQWQYQKTGSSSWTNSTASSGKTATLSVSAREAINGYKYRCVVKNENGYSVTSSTATLTVNPEITKQPTALKAKSGTTGKFTITATGDGLSYQWQYQKKGSSTWTNSTAASGKKATFSVSVREAINGYKYRCKVTNSCGNTVTSSVVTLTVTPNITKQPTNLTAKSGTTAKFSITAKGDGLTYQWQYQKTGSSTWTNSTAASAKKATFSVSARSAINGYKYRCVVKNSCGNSVTSNAVKLTVK